MPSTVPRSSRFILTGLAQEVGTRISPISQGRKHGLKRLSH